MSGQQIPPFAPVFPLPNGVLFPKVLLPLEIFEPRYKTMFQKVLDTHGWMAIALLRSNRELDESGHPDVFPVAGLGRVLDYQKTPDDTYKVVLFGECRARLRSWIQVKPYPVSELERYPDLEPAEPIRDTIRVRLRARIRELVRKSVDSQILMLLDQTIKECEEIGPLLDSLAYHFLGDPFKKQKLLEVQEAEIREQLLLEILKKERFGEESSHDAVDDTLS